MSYLQNEKNITSFIINETIIEIGNQYFGLWMYIEPIYKSVLGIYISKRKLCLFQKILFDLISKYGKHTLYNDSDT